MINSPLEARYQTHREGEFAHTQSADGIVTIAAAVSFVMLMTHPYPYPHTPPQTNTYTPTPTLTPTLTPTHDLTARGRQLHNAHDKSIVIPTHTSPNTSTATTTPTTTHTPSPLEEVVEVEPHVAAGHHAVRQPREAVAFLDRHQIALIVAVQTRNVDAIAHNDIH